jgi:hypothetical protein
MVHLGDDIHLGAGRRFPVLAIEDEDSQLVGLLQVEAA